MISMDTIFAGISLIAAPLLMWSIPCKRRAFVWSVVVVWVLAVVAGQYHLAYTPGYDSFAPALALIVGWLPAAVYSSIWLLLFLAVKCCREP